MIKNSFLFCNKTAVIFDFDGTLADTVSLHEAAFRETLKTYHFQFDYCDYIGMSTVEAMELIFRKNNCKVGKEELSQLVQQKRKLANQSYHSGLKPMADAVAFIELVHRNQLQLFIGSSGSAMNIFAGVRALHIEQYFTDIVTADDVKKSKPDPEIFLTILDRYKIHPQNAIVVEDADSGIEAASRAGIEVACVNPDVTCIHKTFHSKNVSFADLIKEFESYIQHEKSVSSHRYL